MLNNTLYAQALSGTVVSNATDVPIANATVFISSTSYGTNTNEQGQYTINNIAAGNYELVVRCIGYETITYKLNANDLPLTIKFKMIVKVTVQDAVIVLPFDDDGWQKYGKQFMEAYIGTTANSLQCSIVNKDVIKFRYNKKTNILEAVATDIVIIKNEALGYTIKHQLEEFSIDYNTKTVQQLGYMYFQPKTNIRKGKQNKYTQHRYAAYQGSIMHLIRCLYKGTYAAEGFVIRDFQLIPNKAKAEAKRAMQAQLKDTAYGLTISSNNNVLRQPDYFEVLTPTPLLHKQLIVHYDADTVNVYLRIPNLLHIEYTNEKQESRYYSTQFLRHKTAFQTTRIQYATEPMDILLTQNGNYAPALAILLNGYMGWEKLGEALPLDYEPILQL